MKYFIYRISTIVLLSFIFSLLIILTQGCYEDKLYESLNISYDTNISKNNSQENSDSNSISVAVSTMISPVETFSLYQDLINYISNKINRKIIFKQRKTYLEVNNLLREKKLDFAFICTGAFIQAKKEFPLDILVVPIVKGRPYYNAYIIVNKNSKIQNFDDLKNKSFAFTDPLSNTGYSYIINLLNKNNMTVNYFGKTIFTYAHDYSIQAVSRNFVDAASIDGLVFDYLEKFQPEKVKDIRIIQKSKDFGIPPFVVRADLDTDIKAKLTDVMLNMHNDESGKKILDKILIDKFIEAEENLYLIDSAQ